MTNLRISGESTRLRIFPGDIVELGLSHQLHIDGDQTWVSYKVSSKMQEDEKPEDVHDRLNAYLQEKMEQLVSDSVAKVNEMSGK